WPRIRRKTSSSRQNRYKRPIRFYFNEPHDLHVGQAVRTRYADFSESVLRNVRVYPILDVTPEIRS
ncbi:MAG: hypothetical protein ACKVT0_16495, partial [Planctomycetaceae bacterium]